MTGGALSFFATPGTIAASAIVAAAAVILAGAAWRRRGRGARAAMLEGLRVAIVLLLLVTLNQPEWVTEIEPERRPVVAVLWDDSRSMETVDVERSGPTGPALRSRAEAIAPRLAAEAWSGLADRHDVVITPISEGTGPPAAEGTDLATPLAALLEHHPTLRAVVLLSDGDWNAGGPPSAVAARYRTRGIPILAVPVGSRVPLPDLEVRSLDPPAIAVARKGVQVPYSLASALPREVETEIRLEDAEGRELARAPVRIPAKGSAEGFIEWVPPVAGAFDVTLALPEEPGEVRAENNRRTARIIVREESLRVLLVESVPRWEYRYLRNALLRDPGVETHTLLLHPDLTARGGGPGALQEFPAAAELAGYDVVFLGDVGVLPGHLTEEDARLLAGLVRDQASGLVLIPGLRGHQASLLESALGDLYPVILDPERPGGTGHRLPASLVLTEAGGKSLLTRFHPDLRENARIWELLPGFQWYAPISRARAGSTVLAVHERDEGSAGRVPLLVTRPYGTGKVLLLGTDGAWRWREGVEDRYHYRFWGQVVRWMAYPRKMAAGDTLRLHYSPERPEVGDRVTWYANAMDDSGAPVEAGGVTLRIESPSGRVDRIELAERPGEWGLYSASSPWREAGVSKLAVHCRATGRSLATEIVIPSPERERIGAPARPETLEEIAAWSGGRVIEGDRFAEAIAALSALPPAPARVRRLELWSHPIWGGTLVLLLGVFWVGRKRAGMI